MRVLKCVENKYNNSESSTYQKYASSKTKTIKNIAPCALLWFSFKGEMEKLIIQEKVSSKSLS